MAQVSGNEACKTFKHIQFPFPFVFPQLPLAFGFYATTSPPKDILNRVYDTNDSKISKARFCIRSRRHSNSCFWNVFFNLAVLVCILLSCLCNVERVKQTNEIAKSQCRKR